MVKPIGRPMKYREFLEILEDDKVYAPSTILILGESKGLLEMTDDAQEMRNKRMRVRHALARYSANHLFSNRGDGLVFLKGQSPIRGWFGKRWKADLD